MMIKPGISELSRRVDSRYTLVTMAAKRARMLGGKGTDDPNQVEKPVSEAVKEIADGKVGYVRRTPIEELNLTGPDFYTEKLSQESDGGERETPDIEAENAEKEKENEPEEKDYMLHSVNAPAYEIEKNEQ